MVPAVKGRLREVQEVIADGDYTRLLYSARRAKAAAFPLPGDRRQLPELQPGGPGLWYLGQAQEKLHKRTEAMTAYDRVLTDYPLSPAAGQSPAGGHGGTRSEAYQGDPGAGAGGSAVRKTRSPQPRLARGGFGDLRADLSATRHGPVTPSTHTATLAQAKGQAPGPGTANIAVQPLSDPWRVPSAPTAGAGSPGLSCQLQWRRAPGACALEARCQSPPPRPQPPRPSLLHPRRLQHSLNPRPPRRLPPRAAAPESETGSDPGAQPQSSQKADDPPQASASDKKSADNGANSFSTTKKSKFHFLKKIIP